MRPLRKAAFWLIVAALWALLLGVLLEFMAIVAMRFLDPGIGEPIHVEGPDNGLPALRVRPQEARCRSVSSETSDVEAALALEHCLSNGPGHEGIPDAFCRHFIEAHDSDRAFLVRVLDYSVIEFDARNAMLARYGAGLGRMYAEQIGVCLERNRAYPEALAGPVDLVRAGLERARSAGAPVSIALPAPEVEGIVLDTSLVPAGESVFMFLANRSIEVEGALFRQVYGPLPEDTPWDVPFIRYKPNLRGAHSGMDVEFNTNNVGFRGQDVVLPKPEGLFRIVCIGGSTTEEGGSDDTTYPALLEKRLRDALPSHTFEVVNCGVSGMDTRLHVLRIGDYLRLDPDLIILYEGVNDVARALPDSWYERASWWRKAAWHSQFVRRYRSSFLLPPRDTIDEDVRAVPLANIEAIRRVAAQAGVPLALCSIAVPDLAKALPSQRALLRRQTQHAALLPIATADVYCRGITAYNEALPRFCDAAGISYLPVAESLDGDPRWFNDVCHMNEFGIDAKAEVIAAGILDCLGDLLTQGASRGHQE